MECRYTALINHERNDVMNRLYVLETGTMQADKNMCVMGSVIGTDQNRSIRNVWVSFPLLAFLIKTPSDGYILFDTGANPRCMEPGYWPAGTMDVWPTTVSGEQLLEAQLARCGVKPQDVNTVVLSHMHQDHMGNIGLFPNADVYVPREEFMYAQTVVHLNPDPETHGGYIKAELETPVHQYHLVNEDFELTPGVEVIQLPGHTPNLLGLVIHARNGVYILPSDSLYGPENYGPPARLSCCFHDSDAFLRSIEKVRKLARKYDAMIFYSHDGDFFRTIKTAPEYYD